MMLRAFHYQNIAFTNYSQENRLAISGEITNKSGKHYHSVVFRIVLFIKSTPIGNVTITINGFMNGQTRRFEKPVGELEYRKVINEITHYEIAVESAY